MKFKIITILLCLVAFSACGDDAREEELETPQPEAVQDSIPTLTGKFIYLNDAAVLKGEDFVYGVNIDSVALDLAEKIAPLKTEDFDMVSITVKAKVMQNPKRTGWDEIIEIREVLKIPEQKPDSVKSTIEEN